MLVLPLSQNTASAIRNFEGIYTLNQEDMAPYSDIRIQVRRDIRDRTLEKGHREVEITFPFYKSKKRKLAELELHRRLKERLALLSDKELQAELLK